MPGRFMLSPFDDFAYVRMGHCLCMTGWLEQDFTWP